MKDLQDWLLRKVGWDKLLHFAGFGWLACLASTWYYALLIAFTGAIVKELIDKYIRKTGFDLLDILYSFLGGTVTAIYKFIIILI